jgi:hypothetical protein
MDLNLNIFTWKISEKRAAGQNLDRIGVLDFESPTAHLATLA